MNTRNNPLAVVVAAAATLTGNLSAATLYVSPESPGPAPPYATWATAARVIQDAVDAANAGDEVIVTNGVYATGGMAVDGQMTNRVAVTQALKLFSVNGPEVTIIQGAAAPGGGLGDGAIRGVYLADGVTLSGFTVTNGFTRRVTTGGGAWCVSTNAVLTNCVLVANSAHTGGGGVHRGTLYHCDLVRNSATEGAGAFEATLYDCTFTRNAAQNSGGGGAAASTLTDCVLTGNSVQPWGGSGGGAVRSTLRNCVLAGNSAGWGGGACDGTLDNCTLSGNSAGHGGGACRSTLRNCMLVGNVASFGGGAREGTLYNCVLTGNSARTEGGGAFESTSYQCTLTGNTAPRGGGGRGGAFYNCILYLNHAYAGADYLGGRLEYCCASPLPPGPGNLSADPILMSAMSLGPASPCLGAGSPMYATGVDLDGEPWADPPAIGADQPGTNSGSLSVRITSDYSHVGTAYPASFTAWNTGFLERSVWDLGDGTFLTNQPVAIRAWNTPGTYAVRFTGYNRDHPEGVTATVSLRVSALVAYVNALSANSVRPYATWETAARTIQEAVDAASTWTIPGGLVLVTNGVYDTGGRVVAWDVQGTLTNRVAVTKALKLLSVNGPEVTVIQGAKAPDGGNGEGAVRCVYLGEGATLSGFTLTNGATSSGTSGGTRGGGAWCASASAVLTNCTLTGNSAVSGGGAAGGTLLNCALTRNAASEGNGGGADEAMLVGCELTANSAATGGGAYAGTLYHCMLSDNSAKNGGGARDSTLHGCTLLDNAASDSGGGTMGATLHNCTLEGNSAHYGGGGACGGTLYNTVLTGNTAAGGGGAWSSSLYSCTLTRNSAHQSGGGVSSGKLYNCIVWLNEAPRGSNYLDAATFEYSCTSPLPAGTGNIAADPQLVGAAHLTSASPCIGAGNPVYASGMDIDGEPWGHRPSMGADEPLDAAGTPSVRLDPEVSRVAAGYPVSFTTAWNIGPVERSIWEFGDESVLTNQFCASHAWSTPGVFEVRLTLYSDAHPEGTVATATVSVLGAGAYVDAGSDTPAFPYSSWETAARTIQDAVEAVGALGIPSRSVLVTDGIYRVGSAAAEGLNRVVVADGVVVSSVNGAELTVIEGGPDESGVRCAWVGNGSVLSGFTLTKGVAGGSGGGVYCLPSGIVANCIIVGNSAGSGGGAAGGTLHNCTLKGNTASLNGGGVMGASLRNSVVAGNVAGAQGGGVYRSTLYHCTLTGNAAEGRGGGASASVLYNCIVYFNQAPDGANYETTDPNRFEYSCTTPLPPGPGNVADDPQLPTATHLAPTSPCIGAGSVGYASGVDVDGEPWADPPAMGADQPATATGLLTVGIEALVPRALVDRLASFTAWNTGPIERSVWDFGDGTIVANRPTASHAWSTPGVKAVRFTGYNASHPEGVTATLIVAVGAGVTYVDAASANPVFPYSSWDTAATNIQDALLAETLPDGVVLVTNGVYAVGTMEAAGLGTMEAVGLNRVVLTNRVTLQSVNGPDVTVIEGGPEGIRCAYIGDNSVLSGFTLRKGTAVGECSKGDGGGVWCDPAGTVTNCVITGNRARNGGGVYVAWDLNYEGSVHNCIITGNHAESGGGGVHGGFLRNCVLTANSAEEGGGAIVGTLYHCTVVGNSATSGGGTVLGDVVNSIVYFNQAFGGPNYRDSIITYSCTAPLPDGLGNIASDPQLASLFRLAPSSPCIGAALAQLTSGVDIDGEPWAQPPAMGADQPGASSGPLRVQLVAESARVAAGYAALFRAEITGPVQRSVWDFGDGDVRTNRPSLRHAWRSEGVYEVRLTGYNDTHPEGVTATATITVTKAVAHADAASVSPVFPYESWETAARTIQDAVAAAASLPTKTVLVTNGVYQVGSAQADGLNRIVLTEGVTVRSINGPEVTVIEGATDGGGIRCAWVGDECVLSGFTLTKGVAGNRSGGGVYCEPSGVVTNCLITGNSSGSGGGAAGGTLDNCTLSANSANLNGGGMAGGALRNCALVGNVAGGQGGGVDGGTLYNCTLTGNSAGVRGGGVSASTLYNCIVEYNQSPDGANYETPSTSQFAYSCTTPLPPGPGNIATDPRLASATHLAGDSPCIGAGSAAYASGLDLDGEPWADPPAMGADQPGPTAGPLNVRIETAFTRVLTGHPVWFTAWNAGPIARSVWDLGDGLVLTNQPVVSWTWDTPGVRVVRLTAYNDSHPDGVATALTVTVSEAVTYVDAASAHPVFPYASWVTAARTMQEAVDASSVPGGLVLVTNGVYATGGRAVEGELTNRVAVTIPLRLLSVNGPECTLIEGAKAPGGMNGDGAIRCVYLADGASLSGFTLTNGATRTLGTLGGWWQELPKEDTSGGGAWCASTNAALSNCVITANSAGYGGGAYGGTLYHCTLTSNSAVRYCPPWRCFGGVGGGASRSTLYNCVLTGNVASEGGGSSGGTLTECTLLGNSARLGGGAAGSTLDNCVLDGNTAHGEPGNWEDGWGGGAWGGTLYNCSLTGNRAQAGGGAWDGTLYNCTLSSNLAESSGGGALDSELYNCALTDNSAAGGNQDEDGGGGVRGGALRHCTLTGNSARYGGATRDATLYNCSLTGNSAQFGGGAFGGALYNCIVFFNEALHGANYRDSAFEYSCTTPMPPGPGNIQVDPQLASLTHLSNTSPCIGAGSSAYVEGVDIDGEPWATPPAMGADQPGTVLGPLDVEVVAQFTEVGTDYPVAFTARTTGSIRKSAWDFGDGTVLTNQPFAHHAWSEPGIYSVQLTACNESHPAGVTSTFPITVTKAVSYVDAASANPVFPYATWDTAATTIQDAIAAGTLPGRQVLVTNGVYRLGTVETNGLNRVALTNWVVVGSVNGPEVTVLEGETNGIRVRGAYVGSGSVLSGFTLTKGAAGDGDGGGARCEASAVLTNCILTANWGLGGGASGGRLYGCTLHGNWSQYSGAGGAYNSVLYDCLLDGNSAGDAGGGCYGSTLYRCALTRNSAWAGGGASSSTLYHCVLAGNSAESYAGALVSTLYNCTVTANFAESGDAIGSSTLYNCIVYFNQGGNWNVGATFHHSCTTPLPEGPGNLATDPGFVDAEAGDFRLRRDSPCINAGLNEYVFGATDLDGRPRIVAGTVDMGAYEYQDAGMVEFIAWLQRYNLPTDGSADTTDPDDDGLNNWQEWPCQTVPTDPVSVLRLLSVALDDTGVTLSWPGVAGVRYFIERSTDLGATPAFTPLVSELPGAGGTNTFTDTNAVVLPGAFYRVGVQE